MKTKYIYFILSVIMVSLNTACNDNFLEKTPPQNIAAETFWTKESDVQMGLAGCYSRLKGSYLNWQRSYFDAAVDNGWAQHNNDIRLMQSGTLDAANAGAPRSLYTACYQGIASCNLFLEKFKKVGLAEASAKVYEAEARFLRAYFYFELVQRFGGVVVYTEIPVDLENLKIAKSSEADVYKLISEDLNFALANLPDTPYKTGHAVRSSVLALLSRIALYQGKWDEVIAHTSTLIAANKYALAPDLESPFIKGKGQLECPEIIFSVKYLETRDGRQSNDGGQEVEFFRWGGLVPTKNLIDEYSAEDLRLKKWFYHTPNKTTFTREDGFTFNTEFTATDYGMIKFAAIWDPSRFIPSERDIITGHDIVLFRLTDIYLMYAEAQVEKNGGNTTDENALQYVNAIRQRAEIAPLTNLTRSAIRKERRMELAFEGLRLFDVMRWKAGAEINGKLVHTNNLVKWNDKFYIWPFPQSELDINTKLVQNKDY